MLKNSGNNRTTILGVAACFLLGAACLAAAISQARLIHHLVIEGRRAEAMVVGIEKGAKGTRKAVYRFTNDTGETLTLPDAFAFYLVRPHQGDSLTVRYDPSRPRRVTADLGIWTWQGPTIFAGGFILLFALGIILIRTARTIRK